jgi:ribonuclease T2
MGRDGALFSAQMRLIAYCLILLLVSLPFNARSQQTGTPGVFDYYLLTLSWSPEYCYSNSSSIECSGGHHFGFIVHGLWPEFQNGGYPQDCSTAPEPGNASRLLDIMPDPGLIQHEWYTHGTCSGLGAAYFDLIRRAFTSIKIPPQFRAPTYQQTMGPMQIKAAFERVNPKLQDPDLMIVCSGTYLKGVEICLTRSLSPMACPVARSCTARTIRVPPVR